LALSGFLFFSEMLKFRQWLGFILLLAGLGIFYNEQILKLSTDIGQYQKGVLWTLFGAVTWTGFSTLQKVLVRNYSPLQLNLMIYGLPALLYAPFVNYGALQFLYFIDWMVLVFLGLNTLVAYLSLSYALKLVDANKVSVIIILNPIITFVVMALLTALNVSWMVHEHFTFISVVGAAIVILGAVMVVAKKI
jgi:drug/metabolite transporter (DMT)-like permease